MRSFVHDLETDKLLIRTGGKADWLSLPDADRDTIKRNCLWSSSRGCWISRGKRDRALIFLRDILASLGFEDRGEEGERLAFAERVEAQQERAADRADRMTDRAAEASSEATQRFNSQNIETLRGMGGEPVKLGHHSARRHLALIDRADNDMRKGCEAMDRREHYQRRAAAAQATADGTQYRDPAFLGRRIKDQETQLRDIGRKLASYADDAAYCERLRIAQDEAQDKLAFYTACREACLTAQGIKEWNKETLRGMKEVRLRRGWEPICKLNRTTVAVPNICFPEPESQRRWALKYPYSDVLDAR